MSNESTVITHLKARRVDVATKIAALSTSGLDKPNSSGAGLQVDFENHKAGLYKELAEIDAALQRLDTAYNGFIESEALG